MRWGKLSVYRTLFTIRIIIIKYDRQKLALVSDLVKDQAISLVAKWVEPVD